MNSLRLVLVAAAIVVSFAANAQERLFVNVAGQPPAAPAEPASSAGHPAIEKLLTQPANLWERLRSGFAMPALDHRLVAQHEAWYASRPELVRAILTRARLYLHFIAEEVERRGLPTELALLPLIESGFDPMALSPAQASGLWQFIPATATRYNLEQNATYDARRDIVASTRAALEYLEFLHRLYGDWLLALASYNWGEQAVGRVIEQSRARGQPAAFSNLSLPEETRNYVPRLMAIRNIVADPARFGLDLGVLPNEPYFTVVENDLALDLRAAAQLAEMPYEVFVALNPAHNQRVASSTGCACLVLPVENAATFRANLERHREQLERAKAARRQAVRTAQRRF